MQHIVRGKAVRNQIILAAIVAVLPCLAYAEDELPEVEVKATAAQAGQSSEKTKSYTVKETTSATRLETSIRETPQSISVITRQQLDDFRILSVNDALSYATGIKVEQFETDRTEYTARGLNITNFQIDGLVSPISFSGTNYGDLDVAMYDRIEVLRGANGLVTGIGNPSATINFIRKRPTKDFQAKADISVGSWDNRRLDADVSGSLNGDGSLRGRLVASAQDRNSYIDRYSTKRNMVYGVIEADLTDNTNVAIGHTYQQNDSDGNNFGSLPLLYTDGTKRHYKVSDSTAPEWSNRDVGTHVSFAELNHYFNNDWKVKGQLTHKETDSKGRHHYVGGNEDRATGLITYQSYPYVYDFATKDHVADVYANGPFELAGRKHELVVGATWSKSYMKEYSRVGSTIYDPLINNVIISSFDDLGDFPLPTFGPKSKSSDYEYTTTNIYTAAKLNPTDNLKVTVGGSLLSYELEGSAYGTPQEAKESNKFTPYIGAVYDLNEIHSVYASYTGIYRPQVEKGANLRVIAPLKGKNYEAGVKSEWLNKKLNTSFSLFRSEQENQALATGIVATPQGNVTTYDGIQATTKGYEFDVSGEVTDNLNINAGYTRLMSVKNDQDQNVNPFIPRHLVHLTTVYKLPSIEKLKVGASVNWQSDTHVDIGAVRYEQDSYATVNLMANYQIDEHWSAAVNLYNVTDEKYISSMRYAYAGQAFYAPPFSGLATLTWKY